jgi:hypothetical protein
MTKNTPTLLQRRYIHALAGQRAQPPGGQQAPGNPPPQQVAAPPQQNAAPVGNVVPPAQPAPQPTDWTAVAPNRSTQRRYSDEDREDLYGDEEPEDQAGPSVPAEKVETQDKSAWLQALERRNLKADIQRFFAEKVEQALPALEKLREGHEVDANLAIVDKSVRALCKATLELIKHSHMLCTGKPFEGATLPSGAESLLKQKGATMSGGAVRLLEQLGKRPGMPEDLRAMIDKVLAQARSALVVEARFHFQNLPEQNEQAHLEILLEFGGCKPPRTKGMSDLFVIDHLDGTPAYFFKPMEGEAYPGVDWPEGGGAAREVLISLINEQFKHTLDIDFRVPAAHIVRLEDTSFCSGSLSQSPQRVGAAVQAVPLSDNDPSDAGALFCPSAQDFFSTSAQDDPLSYIATHYHEYMQGLNKRDCKNIALLNFVTLNLDPNVGNVLLSNCGTVPDATRLTPIDAGRAFPSVAAFRRGAHATTTRHTYGRSSLVAEGQPFILQTPAATETFDAYTLGQLATMDVDAMVDGMLASFASVTDQTPEMRDRIDPETFDLMRKSVLFLQAVAKSDQPLTICEIADVYANGFMEIVDATGEHNIQAAIDHTLKAALKFKQLGGEAGLIALGFHAEVVGAMTLQQKADALERQLDPATFQQEDYQRLQIDLHDIGSYLADSTETITDELTRAFSPENYAWLKELAIWKKHGGDPRFKKMCEGNDDTYWLEVKKRVPVKRLFPLNNAERLATLGGLEAFKRLIGKEVFDREYRGKDLDTQVVAFEKALKAARNKV